MTCEIQEHFTGNDVCEAMKNNTHDLFFFSEPQIVAVLHVSSIALFFKKMHHIMYVWLQHLYAQ